MNKGNKETKVKKNIKKIWAETVKVSLVYRALLIERSFLLKLKTITMCFKLNKIHNNQKENVFAQVYP